MSSRPNMAPLDRRETAKRVEESLDAIGILAEVLLSNGGFKGGDDDTDSPAQISDRGESGIQSAINIIARMAHRDFCLLATDLGIPA